MNDQVAWDSEYYLSIAIGGYDDPRSPHLTPQGKVVTSLHGNSINGERLWFKHFFKLRILPVLSAADTDFGISSARVWLNSDCHGYTWLEF